MNKHLQDISKSKSISNTEVELEKKMGSLKSI